MRILVAVAPTMYRETLAHVIHPDFRLPSTVRSLSTDAGLREEGWEGMPWWTYTARYRK